MDNNYGERLILKKNVLVLGSGGREHAFAWSLAKDENVAKVYCAPGNGGTAQVVENIALNLSNQQEVVRVVQEKDILYFLDFPNIYEFFF